MKKLSILRFVLLVFVAIFSSGCPDDEDEAKVDCAEAFCVGTLLAEGEGFNGSLIEAVGLAKDDINKAGGNIEIISGNSFPAGQEGGAQVTASTTQLIEMGVHGLVAPSFSSDSLSIHPFLSEKKMVGISPSATSVRLTTENEKIVKSGNQPFFFRVAPSDRFQAPILAKQSQGNTVIVYRDDAWGKSLAEDAGDAITDDGRQAKLVEYKSAYFPDSADEDTVSQRAADVVSGVVDAVGKINAESIVLLVFNVEGGAIVRGLLDSSVPAETGYYFGDGLTFNDAFFEHVDKESGEIAGFKQVISAPPPDRLDEFKKRLDFSDYSAHAYDAVVILRLAALSAGSNDPSDYVSRVQEVTAGGTKCHSYATCAAALTDETTTNDDIDYEGISGPIDLNEYGDITDGLYAVDTYDAQGNSQRTYLNFAGEQQNTN